MSDAEAPVVAAEGAGESKGMPQSDLDFLMACCNNTTGGALQVDINAMAEQLGFKNPRSVTNKLAAFRKKYAMNITSSSGKTAAAGNGVSTADATPSSPTVPKTPKGKVTKPRAPKTPGSSAKKAAPKKAKQSVVKAEDEEQANGDDDMAVKEMNPQLEPADLSEAEDSPMKEDE